MTKRDEAGGALGTDGGEWHAPGPDDKTPQACRACGAAWQLHPAWMLVDAALYGRAVVPPDTRQPRAQTPSWIRETIRNGAMRRLARLPPDRNPAYKTHTKKP